MNLTDFYESNSNDSDFQPHYHMDEHQSASAIVVVFYFLNLILVSLVGYPLYFAIIHYEQFGGDPQKRSLQNMIYVNGCISSVFLSLTINITLALRIAFGPMYTSLANILCSLIYSLYFMFIITFLTYICIRNVQLIKPNLAASLNDWFWYIILTCSTLIFGFIQAAIFFHAQYKPAPAFAHFVGDAAWSHFEFLSQGLIPK